MLIAIDTGGTFTDVVWVKDGRLAASKVFSTPDDPGRAVLEGLRRAGAAAGLRVRHGTTVATNAMLERKGARVAFVTTAGFEDTIAIGRQARAKLYDWFQAAPEGLVPAGLRFGVKERVSPRGEVLQAVSESELEQMVTALAASGAESVAISLLFSFANPGNEERVAAACERLGLPVSVSHRILPEFREYERGSTVAANAYVAPKVGTYIAGLARAVEESYPGGRLEVMQSSGGLLPARVAAAEPVRTMLSGPAGGVIGAFRLAQQAGFGQILGFDMGGTSTDVCLVDGLAGGPRISSESVITGVPIGVPMLDIHTAGAGGGSIARFDAGGLLRVGPESAGSVPGPICFGRGTLPTVTDANLLLGRLDAERFLGGAVALDAERTRRFLQAAKGPLGSVEAFAAGILQVVEMSMEKAIRLISVERGYDPRDFTLVAFGGGGPLHACALARALSVPRVLVPALPGALSAVGILLAEATRDYSRTVMLPWGSDVEAPFAAMETLGRAEFAAEGAGSEGMGVESSRSVDLRYRGQGYELNVPFGPEMDAQFRALHRQRYGFAPESRAIEMVNLRVRFAAPGTPVSLGAQELVDGDGSQAVVGTRPVYFGEAWVETRLYERDRLRPGDRFQGPAIVSEYSSATVLPPGDGLHVDGFGNLVIEVGA